MENKKVYIIVLNWNGTEDTIACLSSLKQLEYDNFQIILVDNGSEKDNFTLLSNWCKSNFTNILEYSRNLAEAGGSANAEKEELSNVSSDNLIQINNGDNLGFAAGNNVALKYILSQGEEPLALLLNNDTEVEPNFLLNLMTFMDKNPTYVACTPQIRLFSPKDKIWNCGGKLTWFGNRRYYYANMLSENVPQIGSLDIEYITGCALLFKPHITGILTEKFFFGEEDFEFSLRVKKQKQKIACVLNSIIYHKVGSSVSNNIINKSNRFFIHYASRLIDHKSYYNPLFRLVILIMNVTYGFFLLSKMNRINIVDNIQFWIKLVSFVQKNDELNKEHFEKIMFDTNFFK